GDVVRGQVVRRRRRRGVTLGRVLVGRIRVGGVGVRRVGIGRVRIRRVGVGRIRVRGDVPRGVRVRRVRERGGVPGGVRLDGGAPRGRVEGRRREPRRVRNQELLQRLVRVRGRLRVVRSPRGGQLAGSGRA